MSKWVNNKFKRFKHNEIERPCKYCLFCPYGQLIEEFPFDKDERYSCPTFGHNCPVYYHAEVFMDETEIDKKKENRFYAKIRRELENAKRKRRNN